MYDTPIMKGDQHMDLQHLKEHYGELILFMVSLCPPCE